MTARAVSFEVYGGIPTSPTGPERLPVMVYDAEGQSEIRTGPLLPDVTRRIEIAARDNPRVAARLSDYAFTRGCAEVMRALMTAYTLWLDPGADRTQEGLENLIIVEFRPVKPDTQSQGRRMSIGRGPILDGVSAHPLDRRHGVVYSPRLSNPPAGALCWTSSTLIATDGSLLAIYAYIQAPPLPEPRRADSFPIITCQEGDALFRAASDGRTGRMWVTDEEDGERRYEVGGLRHCISIGLAPEEVEYGMGAQALERLTDAQDADACFALMYVTSLLVPSGPTAPDTATTGWVDLDDVAAHIWPAPRSREERRQQRLRVWRTLLFGERARIVGRRSGHYHDRATGEELNTWIDGPIWRLMSSERAVSDLNTEFSEPDPPLRVEIVVSPTWTALTSHPNLAQYLPFGEVLGAIPGAQPSGAWARVAGLALASFWRRHPREALDGSLRPSRRELLTRYTPRSAPPLTVLAGRDPRRAVEYWRGALSILVEKQMVAAVGEAARTADQMCAHLPRYEWQNPWLDEHVSVEPGALMREALEPLAARLLARHGAP